jgi:hypothetical protein
VTIQEYECKLAEIDRILNDPEVPFDPTRVWALLADIAQVPLSLPSEAPAAADEGALYKSGV